MAIAKHIVEHEILGVQDSDALAETFAQFIIGTKAVILATTHSAGQFALATDTGYLYFDDGDSWHQSGVKFVDGAGWDMGAIQDSSPIGITDEYISDKTLYDVVLSIYNNFGDSDTPIGAIQYNADDTPDSLQVYTDLGVANVPIDIAYLTGDYTHVVNNTTISIRSGNSLDVGLNGIPIVQEYSVDMGAFPYPTSIDGGTF